MAQSLQKKETVSYEEIIANIPDAVFLLDTDGYIQYTNPAVTSVLGYRPANLENQPLYVIYPIKNDRIKLEYDLAQVRKNGKVLIEGWKTKKDGSKLWCQLTITAIYNKNHELTGFSCILSDTSEKKAEELALRQREERYRLMVEGVKDYSIFMLDPNGYILTWNDGARRISGYSPYEIIGQHFSIFYTAEDLEAKKHEREIQVAISTGKYEEEGWRVKKNGTIFWASVVLTALYNEQNTLIGFSKVTRDLTDRKEYEDILKQSEERYRSLVEQVKDYGIFLMDEKGRIISWNEGAKRINGYTADEIIGKYFSIFYTEEDILNGKPAHELAVAIKEGKYEEEGWRLKKDGSLFWASIVISAVHNADNQLVGFSKVTRDLTERKQSEKDLRDSYDRYRSLSEELSQINQELTTTNEDLEQFTSIVSHDLQEPLRTLKSFLQLIDSNLDNVKDHETLKNYIQKSLAATDRMRDLIRNLLHYSQLGKKELLNEPVDLEELLDTVFQNLKSTIDKSEATMIKELNLPTIMGDKTQLSQLFQNLISNGIKFTRRQHPKIWVKSYEDNGVPTVSITDEGIGMSKDDTGKIFEIFRRLDEAKDFPGMGIGLSICKKIVERHHGRIWLKSKKGEGTTFYFTLHENERPS